MYNIEPFNRLNEKLEQHSNELENIIRESIAQNKWFTRENIIFALKAISKSMCTEDKLKLWLSKYTSAQTPKNVGIIMAGNIPLVGFFDLMCVLISGHNCYIKTSSKDDVLINYIIKLLGLKVEKLTDDSPLDALIATGSDNSNRYFRSRYASIPTLLRKSRTSVAVISAKEDLTKLSKDIFAYFGMGCRNVSKIFMPYDFDINLLSHALTKNKITNHKFLNIYRHQKALFQMRGECFIDCDFFTLRESIQASESLADITFYRSNSQEIEDWLLFNDDTIQCVVSETISHPRRVTIGSAQHPELWDYPDGVDVMKFLAEL